MSRRLTGHAICLMLGFVVAACTGGQPSPTGLGSSIGPGASSSPAAQPQDLGAAEISLRQDDRMRAGLVNLGPGASEVAGLMDASAAHALQDEVTRTKAVIVGPTSEAPTARFVSLTTPGTAIFAPWAFTTDVYEGLMGTGVGGDRITNDEDTLGGCVSGFGTCSGDQTPPKPPSESSGSETDTSTPTEEHVTVAGQPGVITTTATATTSFDGSKVSIDIEIKVSGEIHDANGATIYRINSTGKGHIDGDACPDASGIATAHISFTASESYFNAASGSGGAGLEEDFSADVRIHADDNANLAGVEIIAKAHETSSGGLGAGGGKSDLLPHELNAGATFTLPNDPTAGFGPSVITGVTADSTQATSLILGMGIFAQLPGKVAAKAAETAWRSGMCVRVSPSPNGGNVAKDSTTDIKVTVRQRYDGTELDKPVTATINGPKSLDPAGQAQPAPATFTYTAGPKDNDQAVVTFKSVSNRGIGKTGGLFEVGGSWHIDQTSGGMAVKGQKCAGLDGIWRFVGTIKSAQIDSTTTWIATINGTTLLGTYTYKSVTKSYPSIVTTGVASGRVSIVVQPNDANGYLAGTVRMTVFGTNVTNTVVGAGGEVTVSVPIPDGQFAWSPGPSLGASCQ